MKTRITPWAVVALFVSLLSMLIFALLFETYGSLNSVLRLFWGVGCTASVILPIISKYHRSQTHSRGKGIEIFALVISFFNCQFFLLFTTSINGTVCLLIGVLFVVLYTKLFNNSTSEAVPSIGEDSTTQRGDYIEAANGMTVRVPDSNLESWQAEQDRIKSNPSSVILTDKEQLLADAIVHDIYGSKDNSTTESAPPIAPAQNSNQRYCRMCGGAIDLESKKCMKCGKQYFYLRLILSKLKKVFVVILVLALIASNFYMAISTYTYLRELETLNAENQSKQDRIDKLLLELAGCEQLANDLLVYQNNTKRAISFYDEHIVFAVVKEKSNGYDISYHKFDCLILERLLAKGYDDAPETNSGIMSYEEWKAWKEQQKASATETVIFVINVNSVDAKKLTCPHCFD